MKKLMAILMVCVMALALCACGGSKYVGDWETSLMGMEMELSIEKGGKGSMSVMGEKEDITWEEKNGKLILDSDGEEVEAEIDDGELVFKDFQGTGIDLTFEKVK